ncbi:MAG: hypothetical protein AAGF12_22810 [Myxococcota bacterium]
MPQPFDLLGASFDQAVRRIAFTTSKRRQGRSAEGLGPLERKRILKELAHAFREPEYFEEPDTFFSSSPLSSVDGPAVDAEDVRAFQSGRVVDLSWPSDYAPVCDEIAESYQAHPGNQRAHGRAFFHAEPRPAVILIHGYLGGVHAFEERLWPLDWLFRKGLDPVLFVLPFHGLRSTGRARFPGPDLRVTIDGFRQSIHDLRSLVTYLLHRGAPAVGVMGMSLGGYTSALLSTVEPRLSFVVPFIPLASIADFIREGDRLVGTRSQRTEQHQLLEDAHAVVSPLHRPCLTAPAGRLVVGAHGDRITPPGHAERLAEHLEAPLEMFRGGHILQLGRSKGFRAVGKMLGGLGLLED